MINGIKMVIATYHVVEACRQNTPARHCTDVVSIRSQVTHNSSQMTAQSLNHYVGEHDVLWFGLALKAAFVWLTMYDMGKRTQFLVQLSAMPEMPEAVPR